MRKLCGDLTEEVQETMVEHTSAFRVRPGALASVAGLVIVPVVLAHILTFYLHRAFGTELTKDLKYFFYLDQERNLPTFFAVCLWLLNVALFLLLWNIRRREGRLQVIWLFLACLFCCLAIDEFAGIHEWLTPHVRLALGATGSLYYAWIVPYGLGVLLLAGVMLPVLRRLERRVALWYCAAAVLFVGGAVGMEMLAGLQQQTDARLESHRYFWLTTLEETLEMCGLTVLFYASLLQVQGKCREITFRFPPAGGPVDSA